jgi:hypothetical protein
MKKSLLNYKSLHFAILLLLLCANISVAQRTIIHETFGGVDIADPYTGGTSTTPASPNQITYTKVTTATVSAAVSVGTSSSSGYLSITAAQTNATPPVVLTTTGRTYLSAPIPSGNFVQVLKNNPYPITWTFNMRLNRSTNIAGLTSNANTNYAPAEVLVASSSDLLSETTKGYAVSISLGSVAGQQKIELSSFRGGLGFAGTSPGVAPVSIISSPDFTNGNYVSVKVTYTPSTDAWSLAVKDSGTGPFTDPATDTYPTPTTAVNSVNTSETMTHFGYFYCHKSGNTVSGTVFRTDNYKVVSEYPFVPLPTVQKRQAFNNTITTPKVSDLYAEPTQNSNGIINWYDVPSAGTPLTQNTSLTYRNYYVSQTISGLESERVLSQVFVGDTGLKSLPLYEGFANYNISDKLIIMNNSAADGIGLGSWTITPGTNINDDVTIVASPTWTTNLTATSGNAITFAGSGIDPELKFTDTTSGSLYSSFLFTATDAASIVSASDAAAAANPPTTVPAGVDPAKSTPTGIYSFLSESTTGGVRYSASVMFRKVFGTPNKFNIGLSKSDNAADCIWSPTDYDFGTQYLIMISYENIGDADSLNQVANLWINPTTTTLPIPVPTLTQNNPTASVSRDNIDRIKILQASTTSTPLSIIDEIRVANNWGQALGAASTMGITSVANTGFKMYPNPVSNGKLYISSSTNLEKEVSIFNTLGQRVLQTKTVTDQAITVSNLNKGTYFVKITEDGITATKKLIIQ